MKVDDDHIKALFFSKLSRFEPEVPGLVWDKIEVRLSQKTTSPIKTIVKDKAVRLTFLFSGVASVIGIICVLLMNLTDKKRTDSVSKNDSSLVLSLIDDNAGLLSKADSDDSNLHSERYIIKSTITPQYSKADSDRQQDYIELIDVTSKSKSLPDEDVYFVEMSSLEEQFDAVGNSNEKLQNKVDELEAYWKQQGDLLAYAGQGKKNADATLQLSLNGGSSVSPSNQFKDDFNPNFEIVTAKSTEAKIKHNQPVTFGIGINKRLSEKFSIESGLTYTYLSSRLGAEDQDLFSESEVRTFHYFGIPLTLHYTFARWNKFYFYSSLGGLIQKDFSGRATSRSYVEGMGSEYYLTEKISQENPQFSIQGGLGASYPIYLRLRIYTNIGGGYYFDAQNRYETIYSEKKWLFNLNFGLKYDF